MTIEEMVDWVEQHDLGDNSMIPGTPGWADLSKKAQAIIAALHAGQTMFLDLQTIAKEKVEETGEPLEDFEYFSAQAWYAVTNQESSKFIEEVDNLVQEMHKLMAEDLTARGVDK